MGKKFIIILLLKIIDSQIIIPFKNNLNFSSLTEENFYNKLSNMNITTNLLIGNPSKEILFNIKLSSFHLICLSYNSKNGKNIESFNEQQSSSFSSKDKDFEFYHLEETEFCKRSKENFILNNNIKVDDLNFFLSSDLEKNQSGILGLKLSDVYPEYNFINQLKSKNLISSFYMFFQFKNLNEGNIIIGNYPYEKDHINFQTAKIKISSLNQKYCFEINFVKYGNNVIVEKQEFIFNFENFFIYANSDLKKVMDEKFFNKLLEEKKCEEKIMKFSMSDIVFYVCDDSININKLDDLKFISEELKYEFIYKPKDMFIKQNKKLFFIIGFTDYWRKQWFLGYQFLTKYQIIFNQDKKIIGFYIKQNLPINLIISIIFGFIIIGLLIYIYKILKTKRKIRANELIEDFDYLPQNLNK